MTAAPAPEPTAINTLIMGGWALAGGIMRSVDEWKDPKTGRFSPTRMIGGLAAAVVLGEMAIALAIYFSIDIRLTGALAAILGYLGPAVMKPLVTFLQRKFGVNLDGDGSNGSNSKL